VCVQLQFQRRRTLPREAAQRQVTLWRHEHLHPHLPMAALTWRRHHQMPPHP
jgi:hypothetical protein